MLAKGATLERVTIVVLALAAVCAPAKARAQAPVPARALYAQVAKSCVAEVRRFCPELSQSSPKNQAICLKPYKSDLSFGCRRAVKAAFQ